MAAFSIPHQWKYDVFVSFRGEDIRKNFMDHLFNDFKQKGILAFRDDRELPKGEEISPHLYKAIEESRFLIVIFSKDYASSSWCLRELVKILQCKQMEKPKHEVQIIFYDVKPDVVRKQVGSYAGAFAKHDVSNRTEVDKWREALSMAANLSGWDLHDMTNGFESKFIDSISREILKKLCDGPLHVSENLVGIDFHFEKLNLARFVGSHKVNMLGICGISGIGKTTLTKAIYNLMYVQFEGSCFCEDVKEVEEKQSLTQVQMQMIAKILKTDDMRISSVGDGSMVIKKRMACKPILLVLDDVNNVKQLEALAGSPNWFSPGSLIIFTGKDKQLLTSHKVDEIYEMGNLDKCEALELFCLYAFDKRHPTEDFEELASQVIIYLQGHPLALKIFGRLLFKKFVHVWKSELDRLQTYTNPDIQQKLRPSFDGLASDQKRMFLDIACAFIRENKDFAASVLDSGHCSANSIMEVLADRFLITVSAYNMRLQMHELIQSMAREIVHEEFIVTGKQRRLCISSASSEKKVAMTEAIEVLVLLLRESSQKVHIHANSFAFMKNLRILKISAEKEFDQKVELKGYNVKYSGSLDFLSNELSLFCWHGCPFKYLPSNFYPENIVAIDLSYSHIKQLLTTPKCLRRLKIMKLRHCCNLTTTPDFSEITNLEELDLKGCVNMVTVHPSIGMLKRLVVLNMRYCGRARSFPSKVEMDSFQVLNLSGCSNVNELPQAFWSRCWTSISGFIWKQHPQRSVSLAVLHMLKSLNFSYCNLVQVPDGIGSLSCLKKLNLDGNNFTSLPGSLSQLSHLQNLQLNGCKKLEVLLDLPPSLRSIIASECTSLREVSGSLSQLSSLKWLKVDGCKKLEVLPELPHSLETIDARDCTSLCSITGSNPVMSIRYTYLTNCPKLFKNLAIDSQVSISETECRDSSVTSQGSTNRFSSFLRYMGIQNNRCGLFRLPESSSKTMDIIYEGNSIPNWFTNKSMGNHIKVELPLDWNFSKFRGYGICVVFKRKKPSSFGYSLKNFDGVYLGRCNSYYHEDYFEDKPIRIDESDMIWLHYTTCQYWKLKEAKNFVTFCFEKNNEDAVEVKECGVRLICVEDLQQEEDVTNLTSMFQDLPTLSEHGGVLTNWCEFEKCGIIKWTW
ncbi:NB-ARC domains-containing protein [Artemisia annua]|uniref:ADP-ribosyl cyclase/cyclic ADP-ribose hydrolase n=1 Tax=Artemisia annua TaxID=35608 RepID=A0A2U1KP09_ARTAN|nr:NB-ARC domains-containing protein [Artemisia annua]